MARSARLPHAKGPGVNDSVANLAARIAAGMGRVLVGAERVTLGLTVALLARGHVLIEGVPGTGKTLAVRALALLLGVDFRRIAFTPDLMPSDVVGTTVFNPQTAQFTTRTGPIVANVVLADEVNRTPPKTQAALLEAMEEGRVTIDGVAYPLPQPFLLCATQNPIEYEGTYPLPEAQVDRFMIKVESGYPQDAQELDLLARFAAGFDPRSLEESNITPVTNAAEILEAQAAVRAVHLSDSVRDYVYRIVAATRSHSRLTLGASPRAGVQLLAASQAAAAVADRDFVTPDDLKDLAGLVIPHRLIVAPDAEIEGISAREVLRDVLSSVAVPR
ncbi:MAG: MoxR family ATPase, partial [Candidatus Eremiobacteraeota bacterium]|nr:MoxR family ATPase [Candidatus Eremiobacteraeota bacterium]